MTEPSTPERAEFPSLVEATAIQLHDLQEAFDAKEAAGEQITAEQQDQAAQLAALKTQVDQLVAEKEAAVAAGAQMALPAGKREGNTDRWNLNGTDITVDWSSGRPRISRISLRPRT